MIFVLSIFLFFYSNSIYSSDSHIELPPIILGVGEQRVLKVPELKNYSLGSSVIRVLPLKRGHREDKDHLKDTLLIKGINAGWGDLWILKKDGRSEHRSIRVEKTSEKNRKLKLEKALSALNETEVYLTGDGALLKGEIRDLNELFLISKISEQFPGEIENAVQIQPELLDEGKRKLEAFIQESPYSQQITVETIHNRIWIKGKMDDPKILKSLNHQLKSIFPALQIDLSTHSNASPTIYFRVFLLELKTNQSQSLGLQWPLIIPKALKVTQQGVQSLQEMDIALHQLESNGLAKILSSPELVVRAPGEAELFAGGKLPYTTQSRYTSQLHWERLGLTLKLKVSESFTERVRLDILTEVTHLDLKLGTERAPGVQVNRMTTQVDAQFGVPLLLSGLLQEQTREEILGVPVLKNIPILGRLFQSEDYLNQRSELVAILYPYIQPPAPPLKSLKNSMPLRKIPIPESWLSPAQEKALKESKEYPWNVLE